MRKAKLLWGLLLAVVAAQPPNDDPCGAITLTPSAGCTYVSGNLNGATATPGVPAPGCASYQGGDVWYAFPVPLGGRVIIQVNSGSDLGMAIYSAPGCAGPFTLIECDDDDGPGRNPAICRTGGSPAGCTGVDPGVTCQYNAALTPGTTIWIRIWRYGNANPGNTPFQICVIDCGPPPGPPPNDDPCGAIALTPGTGCTYTSGNLDGATATSGVPAPGCANYQGGDVWYSFVVPASGRVIIQVNSGFDLGMAIYSAPNCAGPFTLIECDDDDGPGRNPAICRTGGSPAGCTGVDPGVTCQYNDALTPGTTIWIRIWRYNNANPGNTPFQICVIDCGGGGGGGGSGCNARNYTAYQCPCPGPAGGSWCDAGCTGAGITIDDRYSPSWITIPFNFYFAGGTYNQLLIGANGHVVFPPSGHTPGSYDGWSWSGYTNDLYSIQFQLDIHPGIGGTICYRTIGTAPDRCFVVQYCNVPYFGSACSGYSFTGELRLCEDGSIQINIDNKPTCTGWNGGGCFVGIIGGPGDIWAIHNSQPCPALTNTCYAFTPPGACRPSTPPPGCVPLAISLHSFTGQQEGDVVWLRWESITEDSAQRYRIERSTDLRSWQEIGELPARGASSVYTFADRELPAQVGSVFYRLWVESEAGKAQSFGPVEVVLEAKRPVRIRQITLRSDEPLTVELLTGDDFILSVWAPTGQRVWEEQVTGPGRHTIPAFVFGRGMHLVQVRTARGELYVYRVLGL